MARIVLKFGGSSVGDESNYFDDAHLGNIAATVKRLKDEGNQVVVVISAMAGETRRSKNMCMTVFPKNGTPEDDMVMSVGEQVSCALLSKLLSSDRYGVECQPFMGWQIPIVTDSNYGDAAILHVEPQKLENCLANGITPIVAGFQGVTKDLQITTLGFDGSDTTAVAVAAAIKADVCQFYKDVRGMYTANPRRVPKARKIDHISAYEMLVLSTLGARILHPRSIKTAMDNGLTLKILPNFMDTDDGTVILPNEPDEALVGVTYFEHSPHMITISVVGKNISNADQPSVIQALNKNKIFAEPVSTEFDQRSVTVEIGWIEQLSTALATIHTLFGLDGGEGSTVPAFSGEGRQVYKDPAIKTD